jgi:hypothetical protein
MHKIQCVSKFFRLLLQIFFLVSIPIFILGWLNAPYPLHLFVHSIKLNFIPHVYVHHILHPLSAGEKILAFAVSSIPFAITLFILWSLIKLFKLYEQGKIFTLHNVHCYRNIAYALFLSQAIHPIYEFVMGLVLTLHNPKGQRIAAISLDQANFSIILIALFMILISWIMSEAYSLQEDHQLTI